MAAITVKYKGSVDLPIYTYPFAFSSTWALHAYSLYAMKLQTIGSGVNNITGLYMNTIDVIYGTEVIRIGNQTGSFFNLGAFTWNRGKLLGISNDSASGGGNVIYSENDVSRFGNNTLIQPYNPSAMYTLPNVGNTAYSTPNAGNLSVDTNNNIRIFVTISLTKRTGVKQYGQPFALNPILPSVFPNWSTSVQGSFTIVYNNYSWMINRSNGPGTQNLWQTDYVHPLTTWTATYESPDGILDFNSIMNANGVQAVMSFCSYGWLYCSLNALTVGGINYAGYGVFIAPDFSWYKLIRILPQDAGSSTWRTGTVGQPTFKMDQNNFLVLKTTNQNTKIYFGPIQPQITSFAFGNGIPIAKVPHNPGLFK